MNRMVSVRRAALSLLIGAIAGVAVPTAGAALADPPVRFCRAATATGWGNLFRCYSPPICYSGNVGAKFSPMYEFTSTVGECRYASDYGVYLWYEV